MINAILIDDEINSLKSLEMELKMYCPEINVQHSFSNPEHALHHLQKESPDLVFLDIEMPNLNGFELIQKLDHIPFDIIFVTAYDEFAIKAFNFNALDYVLKPVRKTKLLQAVEKVKDKAKTKFEQTDLLALLNNLNLQTNTPKLNSIALPTSEGFKMVNLESILYFQADSNYTTVYTNDHSKYLVSRTLKEFHEMLEHTIFFRSHKSYVLNLNYVDRYVRGQGGYLVLKNGSQIPVARAQKNKLLKRLNLRE